MFIDSVPFISPKQQKALFLPTYDNLFFFTLQNKPGLNNVK